MVIKVRPIIFQSIAVARLNVVGKNAAHDEIHAGQVVSVSLQFLREVFDIVLIVHVLGNGLADIEQKRTRAAARIINIDLLSVLHMVGNDLGHEDGNFMRRVELPSLFPCISGEHANEILVYKTKNIVALSAIHGNLVDELDEFTNRLGLLRCSVAQFAQTCFECLEDALK